MAHKGKGGGIGVPPGHDEDLAFPGSIRRNVGYSTPIQNKAPHFSQIPPAATGKRIDEHLSNNADVHSGDIKFAGNPMQYMS